MTTRNHRPHFTYVRALVLISIFMVAVAAVAVPFYSVRSQTLPGAFSEDNIKRSYPSTAKALHRSGWIPTLSLPSLAGETIAVYAADCTTPKLSFNLGETVCAKTDGVDLTIPGNYYVNWHGPNGITDNGTITQNPQYHLFSLPLSNTEVGAWKANIGRVTPPESSIIGDPPVFTVSEGPAIATFAPDCETPKTSFVLGDMVCARISGEPLPDAPNGVPVQRRFNWVNSAGLLASSTDVITDPQTNTFTLGMSASARGAWLVNSAGSDGEAHSSTGFSVSDPANLSTDIALSMSNATTVSASSDLFFTVGIVNKGPDSAVNVQLTDVQPINTTFVSATQTEGIATFSCTGTSTVTCTATSMPKGDEALIVIVYNVNGGTPDDTVITNTVNVTSSTTELNNADNTFETIATVDSSAPPAPECVLDCPDNITVTANTSENDVVGAHVTFESAQPFGDCGAITSSTPSGSFFPVGTTIVTVSAELNGGTCSFNVIVTEAPLTINCPPNQTVTAAEGETTANVNPGTPTTNPTTGVTVTGVRSDDDNDPDTPPLSLNGAYSIGVTYISWTVRETSTGRTATCTQVITVHAADRANLTMSCPPDQTVAAPSGSCEATVNTGTPTTNPSDNDVTVEGHRSDGRPVDDPYPAGVTSITWTAADAFNGQSASCTQTITVTTDTGDTTPPTFTHVPDDVAVTTNSCGQIVGESELGTPEATDTGNNCQPGTVNIARAGVPPGNFFPTGTTTITYTATDAAGNSATATQTVTVTEDPAVPPSVTAPADVTLHTGPGATSCGVTVSDLNATLGTATASDNCPGVTVARSGVPAGNTFPVGNTTVTYTATDRSGNTANDQQVVTVIDNTAPVISCPADITTGTDPGLCSALVNPGTATATDNCDSNPTIVGTRSDSQPLNAPYPKGTTTITWTATDHASPTANSSSCTQTITVVDDEAPVITTNGLTPMLWPANHAYHTFNVTDFVTAVTDNCDSLTVSDVVIQKVTSDETENGGGDGNTFNDIIIASDCKSVQVRAERRNSADGRVYTITFKVTDSTGNVGTKTSTIHVPKNLGVPVVDSGPNYTVNGTCP